MQKDIQILQKPQDYDMWTLLVEDFRAKTSVLPESVQVLKESVPGYGVRCLELLGRLDPVTSSLKTLQPSLFEDLNTSYATFPKSGFMQNGNVYRTTLLDTHIGGRGFTLLPTPTRSDSKSTYASMAALNRYLESGHQIRVSDILAHKGFLKCQRVAILEMVMGFPIGYTGLGR